VANELTTTDATTDLAHANLARYAKDAQGAFAPNTVRALRADTAVFTAWCDTAGVPALPAAPHTVADFIDAMRAASKRPATIRRYVSSIAHLHRAAELPVSDALDPGDVARLFKAMVRTAGLTSEQVARISGHSSRVGAAQDMAASDRIEMPAIMQAGGWKSPQMVARYTQRQAARRSGAAKLAELQNRV